MENISDYIDEIKDKLTEACLPLGVSIKGIESPDKYTIIVNTSVGRACAATKQPVELKENKEFISDFIDATTNLIGAQNVKLEQKLIQSVK